MGGFGNVVVWSATVRLQSWIRTGSYPRFVPQKPLDRYVP